MQFNQKPKKKMGCLPKLFIFVFILILIGGFSDKDKNKDLANQAVKAEVKEEVKVKTPEEIEKEKHDKWIKDQFSAWDGSHKDLVKLVKDNMNDPKSFEHVKTKYRVENKDLVVYMEYRGKNAFNTLIKGTVKARASYTDNTIKIEESE